MNFTLFYWFNFAIICRYGAQHPIVVLKEKESSATGKYVVVGHCCESGDLFSCAPGEPEVIAERLLSSPEVSYQKCNAGLNDTEKIRELKKSER